jgi:cytochrome c oxidase subunit 2
VRVRVRSADVIHSFWVPALHGKTDMIPGQVAETTIQADRPGEYIGQCAEFCGHQHAHMRLVVVAEPPAAFEAWLAAQRRPAPPPETDAQRQGQDVFLRGPCVMCHAIGGTPAGSRVGPDLTHVASRRMLAAGTLPNTTGHLAGWLLDPQGVKPGARMPPSGLGAAELQALLAYLGTLR